MKKRKRQFKVIVYTDSQNTIGLKGRRERFEQNDYRSKRNKRLNNYVLLSGVLSNNRSVGL